MAKLFDLRSNTFDHAAIKATSERYFKYLMNKYVKGRGRKKVMDNYKVSVGAYTGQSSGGISYNRKARLYHIRNSVNFKSITIALEDEDKDFHFWEYAAHRDDPDIGEFWCTHPDHFIKAIAAHEAAHSVQHVIEYCCIKEVIKYGFPRLTHCLKLTGAVAERARAVPEYNRKSQIMDSHGFLWQQLYSELRVKYVNGAIK